MPWGRPDEGDGHWAGGCVQGERRGFQKVAGVEDGEEGRPRGWNLEQTWPRSQKGGRRRDGGCFGATGLDRNAAHSPQSVF